MAYQVRDPYRDDLMNLQQVKHYKQETLKSSLEEQQYQRQQRLLDERRIEKLQDHNILEQKKEAYDEYMNQQKQNQRMGKQNLAQHYQQDIDMKNQIEQEKKRNQLQQEQQMLQQAQQNLDMEKEHQKQRQEQYKRIAFQQIEEQRMKKEMEKLRQEQDKTDAQNLILDQNNRQRQQQDAYKNYYKSIQEHQSQLQRQFAEKFMSTNKSQEIDNLINKGIEEKLVRDYQSLQMQQQKRAIDQQHHKDILQHQMQQKEQQRSTKHDEYDRLRVENIHKQQSLDEIKRIEYLRKKEDQQRYYEQLSHQKRDSDIQTSIPRKTNQQFADVQIDPNIHNPLLNPIPHNIQNPYLNNKISFAGSSGFRNNSLRQVGTQVVGGQY